MSTRTAIKLVNKLLGASLNGIGPLCSATDLAEEYLSDDRYVSNTARIDALVNWEMAKNFTSGFLTGLGSILSLPITVPAALGASWVIQARMVGAIACIRGYRINEDRVRTLMLLAIVGDGAKEIIKDAGVRIGNKLGLRVIEAIPGRTLFEINKRIGFRLLTKAGEEGIINLTKAVPVLGGVFAGTVDAVALRQVARATKRLFPIRRR